MRKALFILGELEDRDILWLSHHGIQRDVAAGDWLIRAGRDIDELYFVLDGSFEVSSARGHVATLALGDVIGEMSFVEKRPPSADVRASTPAKILAIPRPAILSAFAADDGFAARFYKALAIFLSDRLRSHTGQADDNELDDAILDTVHQAGDRFVRLLSLLNGREI
jgi:CRP-like cAMP-binding protein